MKANRVLVNVFKVIGYIIIWFFCFVIFYVLQAACWSPQYAKSISLFLSIFLIICAVLFIGAGIGYYFATKHNRSEIKNLTKSTVVYSMIFITAIYISQALVLPCGAMNDSGLLELPL